MAQQQKTREVRTMMRDQPSETVYRITTHVSAPSRLHSSTCASTQNKARNRNPAQQSRARKVKLEPDQSKPATKLRGPRGANSRCGARLLKPQWGRLGGGGGGVAAAWSASHRACMTWWFLGQHAVTLLTCVHPLQQRRALKGLYFRVTDRNIR